MSTVLLLGQAVPSSHLGHQLVFLRFSRGDMGEGSILYMTKYLEVPLKICFLEFLLSQAAYVITYQHSSDYPFIQKQIG